MCIRAVRRRLREKGVRCLVGLVVCWSRLLLCWRAPRLRPWLCQRRRLSGSTRGSPAKLGRCGCRRCFPTRITGSDVRPRSVHHDLRHGPYVYRSPATSGAQNVTGVDLVERWNSSTSRWDVVARQDTPAYTIPAGRKASTSPGCGGPPGVTRSSTVATSASSGSLPGMRAQRFFHLTGPATCGVQRWSGRVKQPQRRFASAARSPPGAAGSHSLSGPPRDAPGRGEAYGATRRPRRFAQRAGGGQERR